MSGETVELQEVVKRLDRIIELLEPCFIKTTVSFDTGNGTELGKVLNHIKVEPKKRRGRKAKVG